MAIPSCNTCERDKASEQDTQSQIEATNFRLRFPFELAASFIWSQSEKEKRGKKKKEKKKKKGREKERMEPPPALLWVVQSQRQLQQQGYTTKNTRKIAFR